MASLTFSKRLYGVQGNLTFLAFVMGIMPLVLRNVERNPGISVALVVGMAIYAGTGTLGWRYCLRQMVLRRVQIYFACQISLIFCLLILEAQATKGGTASGNLALPLLLQSGVLSTKSRWVIVFSVFTGIMLTSIVTLPPTSYLSSAINVGLIFAAVLFFGNLLISEERARQVLDDTNRKLAEYASQVEELATATERNRLAREIHDNLGHYLTAVNMQIEAALAIIHTDQPRAVNALERAQALTKEGLSEIRRSVAALRANPTENRPLHEAITMLVQDHRASGLDVAYTVEGQIRACSAQVEMTLYRVVQEGLTNIRKHAQASHADLALSYHADSSVRLKLHDNGVGSEETHSGFGLLGIRERVQLLGGALSIATSKGQGFAVQVEIPG